MADQSILKEFLVKLGFVTDSASLAKFSDGIDKATKAVITLAGAVEATALAVSIGVARFASNLEALYFASIRTGSSATNLKAFSRAAQDFGATADDALGSVEGLARFLRNNPSGYAFLESLGVRTRDPKTGQIRDTTDMLVDLGKQLAKMPTYIAMQRGAQFGLPEHMTLALMNGDFSREFGKMRKEMAAADWEKITRDAHRFMDQLRDLETLVEAFGAQVYDALTVKLGVSMSTLTTWLQQHGPLLASRIADAVKKIIDVAEWLGGKVVWLVDKFIEWDKATNGWSTRILGFAIALKFLGGAEIIGGILNLAAAFVTLGAGIKGSIGLAASLGVGLGWLLDHFFPNNPLAKLGEKIGGAFSEREDRIPNAMRAFINKGWTAAQAAGIVANLEAESGLNPYARSPDGGALGIGQWRGARQADFAKWAGHPLQQSNLAEQEDFVDYEFRYGNERRAGWLLQASTNAAQAGDSVSRSYERPGLTDAERNAAAANRSAAAVSIAQTTTIHVDGSKDPTATAKAVADAQERVNSDLVRNFNAPTQ